MEDYKNIFKVDTQIDGSMNIVLRNGRRALIQIKKLDQNFRAEVYRWMMGDGGERESLLTRLQQHSAYQDCAREALGWVDENPELIEPPAETGEIVSTE